MKKTFTNSENGIKLLEFLSNNLELVSKSRLQKQLSMREIKVNGKRVNSDTVLKEGDTAEIFLPENAVKTLNFREVYSDENILVVSKPVMCDVENHLTRAVGEGREFCRPVHRLDRNTIGLVVFALNAESYDILLDAFKNREIEKYYTALIKGIPSREKAVLTAYLKTDKKTKLSHVEINPFKGASKIITEYEVVQKYESYSKVKIKLVTGKTHQIRAHMAFIGHPVLGDGKYGDNEQNKASGYRFQQLCAQKIRFGTLTGKLNYLSGKEIEEFIID